MAHAPTITPETVDRGELVRPTVQAPKASPGKVAMWLFLATEIMFFTGLIGSYVVLRSGSPMTAYSNLYAPTTDLTGLADAKGVVLTDAGTDEHRLLDVVREATGWNEHQAEHAIHRPPMVIKAGLSNSDAQQLVSKIQSAGGRAEVEGLRNTNWPRPYDNLMNPLSIDLTAANTFLLICSSVTMVLGLGAIQRGNQRGLRFYLFLTVVFGSIFVSVQVYEYYQLTMGHFYPVGISADHHFRPYASLFASCFFTMTGFHGAHVTGGVILLFCIWLQSLRGTYTRRHHSAVELAGLYWHFVDLVWIILFTVVYLI